MVLQRIIQFLCEISINTIENEILAFIRKKQDIWDAMPKNFDLEKRA